MKKIITQKELKEYIAYNEVTGAFVRIKNSTENRHDICSFPETKHSEGYSYFKILKTRKLSHQWAFLYCMGYIPIEIDHINGDRTDNRICNLRDVSHKENMKNLKISKKNTSGVVGVTWNKNANKWQAQICIEKRYIHLGTFVNFNEAVNVRKLAEVAYGFHKNHGKVL